MKKSISVLSLLFCFFISNVHAESSVLPCDSLLPQSLLGKHKYKTWLKLKDTPKTMVGAILRTTDSSIFWIDSKTEASTTLGTEIHYSKIKTIQFRRKNKVLRNTLGGVIIGGVIGGAGGYVVSDNHPGWFADTKKGKAMVGLVLLGSLGGLIGLATGWKKEKYNVLGHPERFKNLQPEWQQYSIHRK